MPYSAELMLAAPAAHEIDALCERLEQDPDLQTYRRLGSAPHISLAVYDQVDTQAFGAALRKFAGTLRRTPVELNQIGVFAHDECVLFLAPVVTTGLLDLHRRYHEFFGGFAKSCWDYYRPGNWCPHVTLAMNLAPPALATALERVAPLWRGLTTFVDAVRFASYPPLRALDLHRLERRR